MELRDDDLFSLASSLAELIGAPVTIEDTDSTVLAYSGGDSAAQAVDEARIGTILGRQVPSHYRDLLSEAGVFDRLSKERGIVYIELPDAKMTPRAVIAVRDDDMLLGSVWAAMASAPTPEQETILGSAVPIVARHMIRDRDRGDVSRRRRSDAVASVSRGGDEGVRAADDVGLRGALCIAAVAPADPDAGLSPRLLGSVGLHLDAVASRSVSAQIGEVIYAVVGADESHVVRIMRDFVARSRTPDQYVVAIGRSVPSAVDAWRSRSDADAVVRAMQRARRGGTVATMRDAFADVLAVRVAEVFEGIEEFSPLTVLAELDQARGSELVESARVYLAHGGDIAGASASLHVHPNTLQNRLRRSAQSCGVDLDDADTRLVLMLHLKLRDLL